jgi:zinc D-Ala-D-Ala carboxypeptidase
MLGFVLQGARRGSLPARQTRVFLLHNGLMKRALIWLMITLCFFSCARKETQGNAAVPVTESQVEELPDLAEALTNLFKAGLGTTVIDPDRGAYVQDYWRLIFGEAGIPDRLARSVAASALEGPDFIMELLVILQQDPFTYYLVDKQNPLPSGYEPDDLVSLQAGLYRLDQNGLRLRKMAVDALQEMATAAAKDGIAFTIGSTYRSAAYQAQVYERAVNAYGKETADRESAQSGKSQHQLGLTVDFSPIDDAFAKTPACKWLLENASRFGWSLSFPDGYEEVTGYRWESWHYRFVGKDLAAFIDKYFDGIQQYALQFIYAWQEQAK